MTRPPSQANERPGRPAGGKLRATALKMMSFASIGVVNAVVNYAIFWLLLRLLAVSPALAGGIGALSQACGCVSAENAGIIFANVVAWSVAVSGSYVMNSLITFAAEFGRRLRLRAYAAFAASGLLGLITDTTALLIAKMFMPIMLAKIVAIAAAFIVNFSMSYFVVFRPARTSAGERD